MMPHGKSFLYGLCGTVQGRLGWAGVEMKEFCPQIDSIITASGWLKDQEFDTIHYVMRFGAEKTEKIEYKKRRQYQELEVASQESMQSLHKVFLDRPALRAFLAVEIRRVMEDTQLSYGLPDLPALFAHLDHQIKRAEQIDDGNSVKPPGDERTQ